MANSRRPVRIRYALLMVAALLATAGCRGRTNQSGEFAVVRADRTVSGISKYPLASDLTRVGTYPPLSKSGAGYFYDEVVEYRVWLHPEKGATPLNGDDDYCVAFAQYERAEEFSKNTAGAEKPLVLIRQREWIDEPTPGQYRVEKGERVTEWQVEWLTGSKREADSIKDFLANPKPGRQAE